MMHTHDWMEGKEAGERSTGSLQRLQPERGRESSERSSAIRRGGCTAGGMKRPLRSFLQQSKVMQRLPTEVYIDGGQLGGFHFRRVCGSYFISIVFGNLTNQSRDGNIILLTGGK